MTRNTAHADLVDFAALQREAKTRAHRAMVRRNGEQVEKVAHIRQIVAIGLFTVNLLVWGFNVVEWMGR